MVPATIVMVSVAPVANHVPLPGLWAKTSRVTVSPLTAPVTVSVPVVTRFEHDTVMLVMAWPLLGGPASAPADSGLPIVPKPISARPPPATATPARRTAIFLPTRSATRSVSRRAITRAQPTRNPIPPLMSNLPPTVGQPFQNSNNAKRTAWPKR